MLPILFKSHSFTLYSYPLFMGLGWGIAYQIYMYFFPSEKPRLSRFLFWGTFVFSWIGAKSLFLLTSSNVFSNQLSFWTGGGFVFYGGFLGGFIFLMALRVFGRRVTLEQLWPMLPALLFGHAIGRIGCFLAGCCYGDLTDWWWGIELHGGHRHPTQLIEAFVTAGLGIAVIRFKSQVWRSFAIYFIGYGFSRIFIEILRGDQIRGQWGSLTPSQWISILLIGLGLSFIPLKTRTYISEFFSQV